MTITIIEFIILLLSHAAVGIYSSNLKYGKRTVYIIWGTWVALQIGLLLYSEYVLTNWTLQFFIGFVLALVGQYVIFFVTTKGAISQRLFTILTYSIFFCITITFFLMVKSSIGQTYPFLIVLIHFLILLLADFYFLRYVCPLCRAAEKNITTGWAYLIVVNIVFIVTIVLSSVFPTRLKSFSDPSAITFVFLSISIMAVYPVIFRSINSMSEAALKREVEAQNSLLLAQIDAERIQLAKDSQARHDRRHHNLVLLEFANNNDIESVREYLGQLVQSESVANNEMRYCENLTVNTVLSVYERRARQSGIKVSISARVSRDVAVTPNDLVIVVANLFENAVNAVSKLKGKSKTVSISIKESESRLLVKIENSCKEKMTFEESSYGIGIRSVISITDKYDGMYDFTAEDGLFSAKVSLNLK